MLKLSMKKNKNLLCLDFYFVSKCVNSNPIFIRPAIPTREYTILDIIDISPNRNDTRLKSNNPINPQLIAPIIVRTKHTFCNISIFSPSSKYILVYF